MATLTLNFSRLTNGTIALLCLGFGLAATNANANPCATNMSNGTGYNMSNASGHNKGRDNYGGKKGGDNYGGNKAAEISRQLNTHQSEHLRAAEHLAQMKPSASPSDRAAAKAAESSSAQRLAQTKSQARNFLSKSKATMRSNSNSSCW